MSNKISERVRDTVVEEVETVRDLTKDAARSGAYLYPIKGVIYFLSHRTLWKPLMSKLAPTLTLGSAITVFMFTVAYVPQAAILSIFNGPLAIFSTVILVLSESSTLLTVLSKTFLIEDALIDTFDGTLLSKNQSAIVAEGRQITSGADSIARLGKILKKPFARFTPNAIIRYLVYLPLNFIPVVGTVLFIILQGRKSGPAAHARYFQLKEWDQAKKNAHVEKHKAAYTSFGVVASLLELVPIASILFSFTNTVGAALWAADMETGDSASVASLKEDNKSG
ncbi:MAG: hypothetical protein M1814_005635 [Vezdaea aestivalis]|nr:MAG: hypothetical protein M1814_005635 [Vezdaea aestivalis]